MSTATPPRHAVTRATIAGGRWRSPLAAGAGFLLLLLGALAALALERRHDIGIVGDEVHYLIGAIALGRFSTFKVEAATHWAVAHHLFPGLTSRDLLRHVLPTGYQVHGPAIPSLLAIPVLAGLSTARVTWLALLAAGIAGVGVLAHRSLPRPSVWPMALVALVATPATFLAMTQLYPDLASGTIIAAVWLVAWRLERGWEPPGWALVLTGVGLGSLPLFHPKNLVAVLLLGAAVVVVACRRPGVRRTLSLTAIGLLPVLVFWFVYSALAFHPGLLPKSGLGGWSVAALTSTLGLLVDAQQGLLVQQPWVVVGFAGIVVACRRAPWSTGALVATMLLVLTANGALKNTYGGYSMVGRFGWELVVPLGAAGALFLVTLRERRRGVAIGVLALAVGLAIVEGVLLVTASHHAFYNYVILPARWHDGRAYGWWPGASFFPHLDAWHLDSAWHHAATWWGVGLVVSATIAMTADLVWALERRRVPGLVTAISASALGVCILGRLFS